MQLGNRLLNSQPWVISGGITVTPPPIGSAMSQVFTLTNWGGANSAGLHKRGVWFKKGDVPAGQVPQVAPGIAQFYGLSYWTDGSLKRARLLISDANLAAGASRTYTMTTVAGTLTGATRAIGNAGLVSALTGRDFKVNFANVKNSTGATYGGGSLTASLTTHASTATRWDLLTTGAVADVWQGWGMAGSDAHLKVNWYITRWKNGDGSTRAWQVGAEPALDWWNVAGKSDLTYDAVLADGTTTILSFPSVQHYYGARWLACVNDGSLNAGTVPWVGVTQPTLHATFDKAYAVSTNLIPPYDTAKTPVAPHQLAYVPCNILADPQGTGDTHRTVIDGVGGYNGRGPITRFDSDAFLLQTPLGTAVSRLNALTGLSVPQHYRSNRQRTRPGESADTANTNIVLLMSPKATSTSDFTAQGLPIAVDAYRGGGAGATGADGWIAPAALSTNPWQTSLDSSHAVSYCYYAGLVSGDEWFIEAQLDLALNLAHQGIFTYHQQVQNFAVQYGVSVSTDRWTGLLGQWQENNQRYVGWAQLVAGHAGALVPADHQYRPALSALLSHSGDYIGGVLDALPSDFAAAGFYAPNIAVFSPWMAGLSAVGAYANFLATEEPRLKRLGDHIATWAIAQAAAGRWYMWDAYRSADRTKRSVAYNTSTNPMLPATQQGYLQFIANLTASTGTFTATSAQWDVVGFSPPAPRNGDQVRFYAIQDGGNASQPVPTGVTEGSVAYLVNTQIGGGFRGGSAQTPAPTFQLSATPGGSPMTFSVDCTGVNLAMLPHAVGDYLVAQGQSDFLLWPYLPTWDNYVPINMAALMMARQAGNAAATKALRDAAVAFTAPMDGGTGGYYSAFDLVTADVDAPTTTLIPIDTSYDGKGRRSVDLLQSLGVCGGLDEATPAQYASALDYLASPRVRGNYVVGGASKLSVMQSIRAAQTGPRPAKFVALAMGYLNDATPWTSQAPLFLPMLNAGVLEGIEGPNELNNTYVGGGSRGPNDTTNKTGSGAFAANLIDWANTLNAFKAANRSAFGNAYIASSAVAAILSGAGDYPVNGAVDITTKTDYWAMHFYQPFGYQPSGILNGIGQWVVNDDVGYFGSVVKWAKAAYGTRRGIMTECGAPTTGTPQFSKSGLGQAKYLLNQVFEAWSVNLHQIYFYQLFDGNSSNTSDVEQNYGIYLSDKTTPKPAATAIRRLLNVCALNLNAADAANLTASTTYAPGIDMSGVTISGVVKPPHTGNGLFAVYKPDGSTILLATNEDEVDFTSVDGSGNRLGGADVTPPANNVTITLPSARSWRVHDLMATGTLGGSWTTSATVPVTLRGYPMAVEIAP